MIEESIFDYLPHGKPFVLVDKIISIINACFVGEVTFSRDKYSLNNKVDFLDLIESLAQLSAVGVAYNTHSNNGNEKKAFGYLAKIKKADIIKSDLFNNANVFTLKSTLIDSIQGYYSYKGGVFVDTELVLEVEFSIMLSNSLKDNISMSYDNNSEFSSIDFVEPLFNKNLLNLDNQVILSFNEKVEFLRGHFNNNPIVPGVYIVKAALIALNKYFLKNHDLDSEFIYPRSIEDVRFFNLVKPNEDIVINISSDNQTEYFISIYAAKDKQKKSFIKIKY